MLDLGSAPTDIGTLAVLGVAVAGFLYGIVSVKRTTPTDRITDLVRQRDEARDELSDCERRCRGLERALSELKNGGQR